MLTKSSSELLLLLSVLALSLSCRCPPHETIQDKFCDRDFGAIVRIIDEAGAFGTTRAYRIQIAHFYYRNGNPFPFLVPNYLLTGIHSAACGILFQPGASYAVSGRYSRRGFLKYLYTTSCDYWAKIPPGLEDSFDPPFC